MKKPVHRDYSNSMFPDIHNGGMDEMEAYYEPLLIKALKALRRIETGDRGDWSCACPAGDIAKAIITEADKESE